jgi:hypothetical protein
MNVEIEFKEWLHPELGVVSVDGGLVLKGSIKEFETARWKSWYNLTDEEISDIPFTGVTLHGFARLVEKKLREKNGE